MQPSPNQIGGSAGLDTLAKSATSIIQMAQSAVHEELAKLYDLVDQLDRRLPPVLGPERIEPQPPTGESPIEVTLSPLANDFYSLSTSVRVIGNRMKGLLDRLEL